jgi:hypothetical protein
VAHLTLNRQGVSDLDVFWDLYNRANEEGVCANFYFCLVYLDSKGIDLGLLGLS